MTDSPPVIIEADRGPRVHWGWDCASACINDSLIRLHPDIDRQAVPSDTTAQRAHRAPATQVDGWMNGWEDGWIDYLDGWIVPFNSEEISTDLNLFLLQLQCETLLKKINTWRKVFCVKQCLLLRGESGFHYGHAMSG